MVRAKRALALHHCSPGSIPGVDAVSGLSLLLVLVPLRSKNFSPGTPSTISVLYSRGGLSNKALTFITPYALRSKPVRLLKTSIFCGIRVWYTCTV